MCDEFVFPEGDIGAWFCLYLFCGFFNKAGVPKEEIGQFIVIEEDKDAAEYLAIRDVYGGDAIAG